jgi:hypothetical protein
MIELLARRNARTANLYKVLDIRQQMTVPVVAIVEVAGISLGCPVAQYLWNHIIRDKVLHLNRMESKQLIRASIT